MFCTNCGTEVRETANFCTSCGSAVNRAPVPSPVEPAAPVQYSQPVQPPPRAPLPAPSAPGVPTVCQWCGAQVSGGELSCPRCGATVKAPALRSESGWAELPGRKDMAKLQFGDSFCQIEGLYVPVAEMNLAASDSVYFSHHVLLWMGPGVE